jgi:tetratricopeptide (TPR) repeat protein
LKDRPVLKYLIALAILIPLLFLIPSSVFTRSLETNRSAVLIAKDLLGRASCTMPPDAVPGKLMTNASGIRTYSHETWLSAVWGLRCGNTTQALAVLEQVLSQEPDNLMIAMVYMDELVAQGRTGEARDVLQAYPSVRWQMLVHQAVIAQKAGDIATASALIDGARADLPTVAIGHSTYLLENAVVIYAAANRMSDVLWAREQLAAVQPNNDVVWGQLGRLNFALKKYPAAVAAYTRAVSLSPELSWKRELGLSLGAVARDAGSPLEAEMAKIDPTVAWTVFVGAAIVAADAGSVKEAASLLDSAQEQSSLPPSLDRMLLYSKSCWIYPLAGRVESGLQACQQMVDADPTNADAWGMFGNLYLDYIGDYASALAAYQRSLALNPHEDSWRLRLGDTYLALGKVEAALTEYKAVLQSDPANGQARLSLAALLATTGDVCGAVQHLRLALASGAPIIVERAQQRLGQLDSGHCDGR